MNYRTNHLFFKALLLAGILASGNSMAERNDIYTLGISALKTGNCVAAIKNLYAYYVVNQTELEAEENIDFTKRLLANIARCENILANAVVASTETRSASDVGGTAKIVEEESIKKHIQKFQGKGVIQSVQ